MCNQDDDRKSLQNASNKKDRESEMDGYGKEGEGREREREGEGVKWSEERISVEQSFDK